MFTLLDLQKFRDSMRISFPRDYATGLHLHMFLKVYFFMKVNSQGKKSKAA